MERDWVGYRLSCELVLSQVLVMVSVVLARPRYSSCSVRSGAITRQEILL